MHVSEPDDLYHPVLSYDKGATHQIVTKVPDGYMIADDQKYTVAFYDEDFKLASSMFDVDGGQWGIIDIHGNYVVEPSEKYANPAPAPLIESGTFDLKGSVPFYHYRYASLKLRLKRGIMSFPDWEYLTDPGVKLHHRAGINAPEVAHENRDGISTITTETNTIRALSLMTYLPN